MSLRLILIRHAKSSWDSPAADDHARPLNDRGRRSAAALGQWLSERGERVDLVLSSDAVRTRQTWAGIAGELGGGPREDWRSELYLAGPGTMLKTLQSRGAGGCVLMLGHNPGIAQFAGAMVAAPPDHPRFGDYPTGATLVMEFEAEDWSAVRPGEGRVRGFVVPRDLLE